MLQERSIPVPPYAPQIPCEMPIIHCVEKTAAKHVHCDIATKLIKIICGLYKGCSESKERLHIQPAQLFHCTRSVIWCVQ